MKFLTYNIFLFENSSNILYIQKTRIYSCKFTPSLSPTPHPKNNKISMQECTFFKRCQKFKHCNRNIPAVAVVWVKFGILFVICWALDLSFPLGVQVSVAPLEKRGLELIYLSGSAISGRL
jgi:hypothetical protein